MNRAEIVHQNFIELVTREQLPEIRSQAANLASRTLIDIFDTQMTSRLFDIISRRLSARKESFYTIGSAGHEGNAVLGEISQINDMAFLHYRSCAFAIQRSKKLPGSTPIYDTLLAFAASADDPIAGGRHKVIGSKPLFIPPQTSTIASHLPKAVGTAHALGLYNKVQHDEMGMTDKNIVLCSFGDASANHSTAQGAINSAAWAAYQHSPMPILFICEDNGIGISTRTPTGWIEANFSQKPGLAYYSCNGLDISDLYKTATDAMEFVRKKRKPAFLHVNTVRLMGHAGSDIETSYLNKSQILNTEKQDPLLYSAALAIQLTAYSNHNIVDRYRELETQISCVAENAIKRKKQESAVSVLSSIWPDHSNKIKPTNISEAQRQNIFEKDQRFFGKPLNMAKQINLALTDILAQYENSIVFGEDVANKGGVYGVTKNLLEKFGPKRVTNTLLDEQTILGMAIGLAHAGYLPIPEIQYLAYVHNAEDQIRGEAASLSFFSQGQFTNPMVIRIAGFAYQKGFGGHFHNDNALAVFRDIPGIIVVAPSNGQDAAALLHTCTALAHREQKVVIFIEPIALYITTDLHNEGDNLWTSTYQLPEALPQIKLGEINVSGSGKDLCIISYANGFYLSHKAVKILKEKYNTNVKLIDLRWLHPLPIEALLAETKDANNILIVDECRRSGSVSEALFTAFKEHKREVNLRRLNAEDSFIPLGAAANLVLPSVESIVDHAVSLLNDTVPLSPKMPPNNDEHSSNMGATP